MGDDTSLELYGPAYGIVLQWLSPNELASLRLCCRAWKFWVDLNLTQLVPFNAENSSVCSPFNVSRLTYRSRFPEEHTSHGSRIHSPFERKKGILSISRTFGHLTSITLDCTSKGCLDIQNLALLPHLTSCQLLEFPFKDRHAISKGVGKRTGLRTLVLHSTKVRVKTECNIGVFAHAVEASSTHICRQCTWQQQVGWQHSLCMELHLGVLVHGFKHCRLTANCLLNT